MKKEVKYIDIIEKIDVVKKYFEKQIEKELNLVKVPSPLFVRTDSGLQDDLTGVEKGLSFIKNGEKFEVVHSLAKWKRDALGRYNFPINKGLYTNMKAIRKDEIVDDIHSMLVEQWDWEKVISKEDRNIDYLKDTVKSLYKALRMTLSYIKRKYKDNHIRLPKDVFFITSQELEDLYPNKTPKEREELIVRDKKAVFITQIGDKLKSGIVHDLRSPDYDDWQLNGDLLVFDNVLNKAVELSSMGIRVDEKSLVSQLEKANCLERLQLPYHQKIEKCELPYTIGGGIGESRILMFLLEKTHIAEVQASSWNTCSLSEMKNTIL